MKIEKRQSLKKQLFYLTASFLSETFDSLVDVMADPYDISGYPKFYRQQAANIAYQLKKVGEIERVVTERGDIYFRLTDKGKKRLIEEIPLLRFQRKKWDGKWRQVIFDIPEEMRVRRKHLREKLISLGFGMLQRSVYITPFDITKEINDFLEENDFGEHAIIFEMERLTGESEQDLANAVWQLDDLHFRYLNFTIKWQEFLDLPKSDVLKKFEECREEYFSILQDDPGLPRELLPNDWFSSRANKVFKNMISCFRGARWQAMRNLSREKIEEKGKQKRKIKRKVKENKKSIKRYKKVKV